ncbi:lipopolysaccharide transport periplasmic protein LptA [Thalassotalea agariperforans]
MANNQDFNEDILISADRQGADLKTKTSIYFDNVVISQGSLKINADLAQVSNKNAGPLYTLKGNPAKLTQTLDDGNQISLEAQEITYQPDSFLITISGQAKLQQKNSQVLADEIIYHMKTERLDANGLPAKLQQGLISGDNISLQANNITFQPALSLVSIKGNAKLKQEGSEVHANEITYNMKTEQMEASGNTEQAVTTILQPQLQSGTNNEQ